jgi:hypothetical protein
VQSFSNQVQSLTAQLATVLPAVDAQSAFATAFRAAHQDVTVAAAQTLGITLTWPAPFTDNYTATVSVESPDGQLVLLNYAKSSDGRSIVVSVQNIDTHASHSGAIHAIAKSAA